MITIPKSQLQSYQQQIAHLSADNIIYSEEIERLRKRLIELQDYQIRYELLLEKQTQQSPLQRSRRVDELNNMNVKIEELNDKWKAKWQREQQRYQEEIRKVKEENERLKREVERLQDECNIVNGLKKEGKSSSEGNQQGHVEGNEYDPETLLFKLKQYEKQNHDLQEQLLGVKVTAENRQSDMQAQIEQRINEAKTLEKQFYRDTIKSLQSNIAQLHEQIEHHKQKASPQRQQEISRLNMQIQRIMESNTNQIEAIVKKIQQSSDQNKSLNRYIENYKKQTEEQIERLGNQLLTAKQKVFNNEKQLHYELIACREQMKKIREKQVNLLKEQFDKIQKGFDIERQQWKQMIQDQQVEVERIKNLWQNEKQKYMDEKNKLKEKIQELRSRIQRSEQEQKAIADGQTHKMIMSLKKLDEYEDKYNDYENGITFLHRQLKRATAKIEQKCRDSAHLLKELKDQKIEFEHEVEEIKKSERSQVEYFRQKLLATDENISKLLEQIRQKEKYIKSREEKFKEEYGKIEQENDSLKNLLDQMERDYRRLTDNRKDLYRSYRSERDNVFTGKNELNAERKRKWLELDRQKNELEISYKERERQIRDMYELKVKELQDRLNKKTYEADKLEQELSQAEERLKSGSKSGAVSGSPQSRQSKRAQLKEFNKKAAALDLEISLTQNLYNTLSQVRNITESSRKRTTQQSDPYGDSFSGSGGHRLQTVSKEDSHSMTSKERKIQQLQSMGLDEDDFVNDNVAPTFSIGNNRAAVAMANLSPSSSQNHTRQQKATGRFNYPNENMRINFKPSDTFGNEQQEAEAESVNPRDDDDLSI